MIDGLTLCPTTCCFRRPSSCYLIWKKKSNQCRPTVNSVLRFVSSVNDARFSSLGSCYFRRCHTSRYDRGQWPLHCQHLNFEPPYIAVSAHLEAIHRARFAFGMSTAVVREWVIVGGRNIYHSIEHWEFPNCTSLTLSLDLAQLLSYFDGLFASPSARPPVPARLEIPL
jgi:hypothetical protein